MDLRVEAESPVSCSLNPVNRFMLSPAISLSPALSMSALPCQSSAPNKAAEVGKAVPGQDPISKVGSWLVGRCGERSWMLWNNKGTAGSRRHWKS